MQWRKGSSSAHGSWGILKKSPRRQARSHKVRVRRQWRMISDGCSSRAPLVPQQHWRDPDRQKRRPDRLRSPS
jgi:hypothetical protein